MVHCLLCGRSDNESSMITTELGKKIHLSCIDVCIEPSVLYFMIHDKNKSNLFNYI